MACKKCLTSSVWEFTNQTKLCRPCFINYFEKKVFKTIRKYNMLPKTRIILLKKDNSLNYNILKEILGSKFTVKQGNKFVSENLSECAEKVFSNLIKGKFDGPKPCDSVCRPLYFNSDEEIELYAKLKSIKGKKRDRDARIRKLFEKFEKNPDLEHNIVNAFLQL